MRGTRWLGRERRRAGSRRVRSDSEAPAPSHVVTTPRGHRAGIAPASVPTPSSVHQSGSPEGIGPSGRGGRGCRGAGRAGAPHQEQKSGRRREFGRVEFWRRASLCTPGDAGKRCWLDDPRLHRHLTFLIRRQDDAPRFLLMVRMDITLNVIPPCHLRGSAEVRTVTPEAGDVTLGWSSRTGSSGALC